MEANSKRIPPPDEDQISQLLSNLQPGPGERFYRQIEKAPWVKSHANYKQPSFRIITPKLAIIAVLLVCLIWAAWPRLEVLARQVTMFFLPNPSDNLSIEISTPATGDVLIMQPKFELSLAEAQHKSGFIIYQIDLAGLTFKGATYDEALQSVMQFFTGAEYNLYLVQRLNSRGISYFSIGASATVEPLTVRGVSGEYVYGGWKGIPTGDPKATPNLLQATWDAEQPQQTLRWSEGGYSFELRCYGVSCPSKNDLIEIADHLR